MEEAIFGRRAPRWKSPSPIWRAAIGRAGFATVLKRSFTHGGGSIIFLITTSKTGW